MYLFQSIIDICIIIFLLRLLIRPNEAYFDPIYHLIYRITDTMLVPVRYLTRHETQGVLISILGLVVIRGLFYISAEKIPVISGVGISLLNLFQLLYQAYMVFLIVSVLSRSSFGTPFLNVIQRAFLPLNMVSRRVGVQKQHFHLFVFLGLWILYALLSFLIHVVALPKTTSFTVLHALGEGLLLILGLFQGFGFFSLVIIVGALLSWVSPDPRNPIVQTIYGITEPLLRPFRQFVPLLGGLDISPMVALLCFQIVGRLGQQLVVGIMRMI
ncbi:MAG: YggT family protein [Pseudomonadota bacterium]